MDLKTITKDTDTLISALKQHNIKDCQKPFAIKLISALEDLMNNTTVYDWKTNSNTPVKLSQEEERQAFLTLVDGLSRVNNSGLSVNDHELIYFIKRGKLLTVSTHYSAPFRVAKDMGYMIVPTFYEIYSNEDFEVSERRNNEDKVLYDVKHKQLEFDRSITAEKLTNKTFKGFALRLSVSTIQVDGKINFLFEAFTSMTPQQVIDRSMRGDNGIFKSFWQKATYDPKTKKKLTDSKKVILNELNEKSIWLSDTKAMVYKTLIREITRPLREALPQLEKMYQFMDYEEQEELKSHEDNPLNKTSKTVDTTFMEIKDVDLKNPDENLKKDVAELLQMYDVNPTLAEQHLKELTDLLNKANEIINNQERQNEKQKIINQKAKYILAVNSKNEKYKETLGKLFKKNNNTKV